MTTPDLDYGEFLRQLLRDAKNRTEAIHTAYQHFENAGLILHVIVHRYLSKGCGKKLATVIRLGDTTIARTTDYKFSPGLNLERSVESARERSTLDGDRHWPGHTYDVGELAEWGPTVGFDVICRHVTATVHAADVLEITRGVKPGHPGPPTRL